MAGTKPQTSTSKDMRLKANRATMPGKANMPKPTKGGK
jgi:hypothetical protein